MKSRRMVAVVVLGLAMISAACTADAQSNPNSPSKASLDGTSWSLVELNGSAVSSAGRTSPTLLLAATGGRASGFAGCNQFSASYTQTGDTLRIAGIAITRMFCSGGMDLETDYIVALESARTYRVADTRLELLAGEKVIAKFEKR